MKSPLLMFIHVYRSFRWLFVIVPVGMLLACANTPVATPHTGDTYTGNNSETARVDQDGNKPLNSIAVVGDLTAESLRHAEEWGVQVLGLRPTADGYMLDFRYRVLDAKKAAELVNRKVKPYLHVEKDGSTLMVPVTSKLGPLRQSAQYAKENRNYFMFFANPNKHVKSGDQVTLVIGDFKVEHLVVN
ncbi:MAG TPA: hypothetical protein VIM41_14330 [Gammaproteobacteria bacterium]